MTLSKESYDEMDSILCRLPVEFAIRWCEPGPMGCFCLGCANGPEAGAGNLSAKGFTKDDWKQWMRRRGLMFDLSGGDDSNGDNTHE